MMSFDFQDDPVNDMKGSNYHNFGKFTHYTLNMTFIICITIFSFKSKSDLGGSTPKVKNGDVVLSCSWNFEEEEEF